MTETFPPRYELLTRQGCHLCDEMAGLLDRVFAERGLTYGRVDVDRSAALRERWGETVPVLLRDGRAVAKVRLSEQALQRILRRRRPGP
jgi:hypothetical protein